MLLITGCISSHAASSEGVNTIATYFSKKKEVKKKRQQKTRKQKA